MTLQITPLSDALGAEVSGVDWKQPVDAATVTAINTVFFEYHLLCLRSEPLQPVAFAQVARYFGEPQLQLLRSYRDGEAPEVSVLDSSYQTSESKPADLSLLRRTGWHTDDSYFTVPAKATLLQSLANPEHGGETCFCNLRAAYDGLSEEMKARVGGRQAVHGYDTMRGPRKRKKRPRMWCIH